MNTFTPISTAAFRTSTNRVGVLKTKAQRRHQIMAVQDLIGNRHPLRSVKQ